MKKLLLVVLIFQVLVLFAQNSSQEMGNCLFVNEEINSSNFKIVLNKLDSIIYSSSNEAGNKLIDCLISIDSSEPELYWYKACLTGLLNFDTSDCQYYRKCINLDFKVGLSYCNTGISYYNFLKMRPGKDSANSLSLNDSIQILDFAEKNMWCAARYNVKYAYFCLGEIQNLKNVLLSIPDRNINIDNDSIIIIAEILDCGEFGGHFEKIIIKNIDGNFFANFTADSIYCMNENPRLSENARFNSVTKPIRKNTYNEFIQYFLEYDEDYGGITNAPFDIAIIENDKVISKNIHRYEWPHYLNFRSEVFGF